MDPRIAGRNVVFTLIGVAALTFAGLLIHQAFTAPTANVMTALGRCWTTWTTYALQVHNWVVPITTAVVAQFVSMAHVMFRSRQGGK